MMCGKGRDWEGKKGWLADGRRSKVRVKAKGSRHLWGGFEWTGCIGRKTRYIIQTWPLVILAPPRHFAARPGQQGLQTIQSLTLRSVDAANDHPPPIPQGFESEAKNLEARLDRHAPREAKSFEPVETLDLGWSKAAEVEECTEQPEPEVKRKEQEQKLLSTVLERKRGKKKKVPCDSVR
ncbi:hypothetical protein IE53DRAFT_188052 [Violaceomyces palustris]|uniref:Uncharacterized protein n=1 Tax=Violaceomyces palustris TaxID=1673888 RepID=A0ACD0NRY8_9BASI|nr:hypothetical protein IE53DRAFT_188052 [Violaceomyces palustris]